MGIDHHDFGREVEYVAKQALDERRERVSTVALAGHAV